MLLGEIMKQKLLTWALVASIPMSAIVGAGAIYLLNELYQKSSRTTYTKEEEIATYDRVIEMADKNEIEPELVKKVLASQRKSRIATHKIMDGSNNLRDNAIVSLFFVLVLQMILLRAYLKSKDER